MLAVIILTGCKPKDYSKLPSHSRKNFLQAVIEIPAGSNLKTFYCPNSLRFKVEMVEGEERKVSYLPFPVNYGFIPSTRIGDSEEGGKTLDVMVVAEKLDIGTVIEIMPLGMLILKDDFKTEYMVLAVPAKEKYQVLTASTLQELNATYPELTVILEEWFLYSGVIINPVFLGWENEHVALGFINKWVVDR
jgi:inorganic pyrophosphatase